jgi:hypothetical protein
MVVVVGSRSRCALFLPKRPVFNKMVLEPTSEEDLIDLDYRESMVDYTHLISQVGTATTNLMPSASRLRRRAGRRHHRRPADRPGHIGRCR